VIQAQTSCSTAHRIMIFKEIELFNIRQFDHKKFEFTPGFNLIKLGPSGGKSTIIESLRAAFTISKEKATLLRKGGFSDHKILVRFEIESTGYTISKEWKDQELVRHLVESENDGLRFDLTAPDQAERWADLFVKKINGLPVPGSDLNKASVLFQRYQFFLDLLYSGFEMDDLTDESWFYKLFHITSYGYINGEILKMENMASDHLTKLKITRQSVALDQKIVMRFEQELKQTDLEINRIETMVAQLVKNAEGEETELHQAEKVHDFISTIKNEIERIDFELRSYHSLLKNNIAGEFTDDEVTEIDRKRKMYEQLSKREEMLQQNVVERTHLERNLDGILNEIRKCQVASGSAELAPSIKQIEVYETEVKRIGAALKSYQGLEHELETVKKEKQQYQPAFDKFQVMAKLKQVVSQNEQKKIRSAIEKLEQDRESFSKELEQIQSSVQDERYRSLTSNVLQKRQQIIEQRKRMDELVAKRLQSLREFEETVNETPDVTVLESRIRKQLNTKKYLKVIGEVSQFIQGEVLKTQFEEFRSYAGKILRTLPDSYVQILDELMQRAERSHIRELFQRFSHTEMTEFKLLFRLLCLSYVSKEGAVVLDEHYRWLLDSKQISRVESLIEQTKFAQIIAFDKT
jgi:hypothetical protein